jgi:hypothetical protein
MKQDIKIKQIIENYQKNPNEFFLDVLGAEAWEIQQKIAEVITNFSRITIRSCHASGKTWLAGRLALWFLYCHPRSIVITTAPTFRQVEEVLWREIRTAYANAKIRLGGTLLKTKLDLRDDWFAIGLSTDHPEQFQGFHAEHILIIADEASGVPEPIFQAIEGIMASGKAKLILIGNPTKLTGYFADSFKDPRFKPFHISAFDTPNIKAKQLIYQGLINLDWVEDMRRKYGEDSDVYRVRVLGEFPKAESDTLIPLEDIERAMKREVEAEGEKVMGVDVARFGDDKSVILVRQGKKVLEIRKTQKQDTMAISGEVIAMIRKHGINPANVNIDVVGLGAGVVDRLREQGFKINGVNVGEKAKNEEQYANLRAELYDKVKQEIKEIALLEDEDFYQLANIKYKFNSAGKLQIESKEEMKKRGLTSPDIADALCLSFATELGISRIPSFLQYAKKIEQEMPKTPKELTIEDLQKMFREGRFFIQ